MDRPPPVAATMAVMSTMSSRPNSHATGRGRPPGPNRSRTPDETAAMSSASVRTTGSWPGTKPDGMTGPTASSSPASPSRAQANPRSSALTLSAFTTSLHHRDQLEDRQVHCDDEATDDDAEEHDHERLEQRRERGHRGVDLVVVEVGDLLEHLVESAGVLAHVDHVYDHGREHGTALQRLRERAARGDGRARLHHRGLDDAVPGRPCRDEKPLEDRDTGRDERAERAREPCDRDLADEHADDRHLPEG